ADKTGDGSVTEAEVGSQRWQRLKNADANNDNKVSKDEIKAHFKAMRGERFKKADKNGDGFLTEAEVGSQRWQRLKNADANNDNKVSKDEIKAHFKAMRGDRFKKPDTIATRRSTDPEVGSQRWQRLKNADANNDNKVSKDEIKAHFKAAK